MQARSIRAFVAVVVVSLFWLTVPASADPLPAPPAPAVPPTPVADPGPAWADPSPDPLYDRPPNLDALAPGDIIRARPATNPFRTIPSETWQIAFRSTDSHGDPIVGVTMVMVPFGHADNVPLVSYQMIINGLGMRCQPSESVYTTTDPLASPTEPWGYNFALARGWALAIPDHLGPDTAYGATRLGAHIVLDGLRAATRLPELRLAASPLGVAGYSGGGMTTAMAAALQPTYAPELNLVASAQGGVPANLEKMARTVGLDNVHPAFGLVMAAALGLEREYPAELPISRNMNTLGLETRALMRTACTTEINVIGLGKDTRMLAASTDLIDSPEAWKVLQENSLETSPEIPHAAIFEWHSPTDPLVPVDSIEATTQRYCDAGVSVDALATPAPEHLSAAVLGFPFAYQWMADRFAGLPAPSTC